MAPGVSIRYSAGMRLLTLLTLLALSSFVTAALSFDPVMIGLAVVSYAALVVALAISLLRD